MDQTKSEILGSNSAAIIQPLSRWNFHWRGVVLTLGPGVVVNSVYLKKYEWYSLNTWELYWYLVYYIKLSLLGLLSPGFLAKSLRFTILFPCTFTDVDTDTSIMSIERKLRLSNCPHQFPHIIQRHNTDILCSYVVSGKVAFSWGGYKGCFF